MKAYRQRSLTRCRGRWQHLLADTVTSLLLVMGHGAVIMCQVRILSLSSGLPLPQSQHRSMMTSEHGLSNQRALSWLCAFTTSECKCYLSQSGR